MKKCSLTIQKIHDIFEATLLQIVFHFFEKKAKKKPCNAKLQGFEIFSDRAGARTRDPLIKSQMLYRLSYQIYL
jgi:hypothetical protein